MFLLFNFRNAVEYFTNHCPPKVMQVLDAFITQELCVRVNNMDNAMDVVSVDVLTRGRLSYGLN